MTDSDNAFLDLIHLAKTASLELAKTVIRLFRNHTKLVTITLYVTVTPAGTLLCQGRHTAQPGTAMNATYSEVFSQHLY